MNSSRTNQLLTTSLRSDNQMGLDSNQQIFMKESDRSLLPDMDSSYQKSKLNSDAYKTKITSYHY